MLAPLVSKARATSWRLLALRDAGDTIVRSGRDGSLLRQRAAVGGLIGRFDLAIGGGAGGRWIAQDDAGHLRMYEDRQRIAGGSAAAGDDVNLTPDFPVWLQVVKSGIPPPVLRFQLPAQSLPALTPEGTTSAICKQVVRLMTVGVEDTIGIRGHVTEVPLQSVA